MAGKAEKLNSGNYRVRTSYVNETGKQISKGFTASTAKEAKFLAMQFEVDHKHKARPENVSFKDAIESFLSNRENVLSVSTVVGYQQLKRNAYASIIDMRVGLITKEKVQKVINEYAKDHAPKSVRNALGFLSSVLREYHSGLKIDGIILPKKKKVEIIIPTTDEVERILQETKGTDMYLPVMLGAMLGMRRSEIFALTWSDIDLKKKMVTIDKAVVKDVTGAYVIKGTKTTSSERKLALLDSIVDELKEKDKDEPLLAMGVNAFSQRYRRLCKRVDAPTSFHTLRHYNASVMLSEGVPNRYAQDRLGHATDDMLKKVYQHIFDDKNTTVNLIIEDFFKANIKVK
ncbi:MAG: site-specific integrase [Clostridia bacterium]|jgi:integrase|nr:site-specific integrase [Clostridia bacterium]MBT7121660.1 site-specific integrase [Clostridia bacterium]